jgi:hypothetical protein
MIVALLASLSLSLGAGDSAIRHYEHAYWKGSGAHVTIYGCRRENRRQVSCLSSVAVRGGALTTRDFATRLEDGRVRVKPGRAELLVEVVVR